MAGSDFQTLLLPFLENLKEGEERSMQDVKVGLIKFVELSDEALKLFDLDKDEKEFQEAVVLAKEHLTKADLIESTKAGGVRITSFGKMILGKRLNSIDIEYLRRLPGYKE
jgi:restriction endonuclease Mrr